MPLASDEIRVVADHPTGTVDHEDGDTMSDALTLLSIPLAFVVALFVLAAVAPVVYSLVQAEREQRLIDRIIRERLDHVRDGRKMVAVLATYPWLYKLEPDDDPEAAQAAAVAEARQILMEAWHGE